MDSFWIEQINQITFRMEIQFLNKDRIIWREFKQIKQIRKKQNNSNNRLQKPIQKCLKSGNITAPTIYKHILDQITYLKHHIFIFIKEQPNNSSNQPKQPTVTLKNFHIQQIKLPISIAYMSQNTTTSPNITWYSNVYYSYRDYPIKQLNTKYKKSQLKGVYNSLMRKMFSSFEIKIFNSNEDDIKNKNHQDDNSSSQLMAFLLGDVNNNMRNNTIDQNDSVINDNQITDKSSEISNLQSSPQNSSNHQSSSQQSTMRQVLLKKGDNMIKVDNKLGRKSDVSLQEELRVRVNENNNSANDDISFTITNHINNINKHQHKYTPSVQGMPLKSQQSIHSSSNINNNNNMTKSKKLIEIISQSNNSIPQSFANKETVKRTKMREQQEREYFNIRKMSMNRLEQSERKMQTQQQSKWQTPKSHSSHNPRSYSSTHNANHSHQHSPSHQFPQQQSNMSVFYELMIKMIPLTLKRVTVEIDQEVKQIKDKEDKIEVIKQIEDRYEQGESSVGQEGQWGENSQDDGVFKNGNNNRRGVKSIKSGGVDKCGNFINGDCDSMADSSNKQATQNQSFLDNKPNSNIRVNPKDKQYTVVVSYAGSMGQSMDQVDSEGINPHNDNEVSPQKTINNRRNKNQHHVTYSGVSYQSDSVNNQFESGNNGSNNGERNNNISGSNYNISNQNSHYTNNTKKASSIFATANIYNNINNSNNNNNNKQQQQTRNSIQKSSLQYSSLTDINYPDSIQQVKFYFLQYSLNTQVVHSDSRNRGQSISKSRGKDGNNDSVNSSSMMGKSNSSNSKNNAIYSKSSNNININRSSQSINNNSISNNNTRPNAGSSSPSSSSKNLSSIQQQQPHPNSNSHSLLQTVTTRLNQLSRHQSSPQHSVCEIQSLVMKYSILQIKSFNLFFNHFYSKIENTEAVVNVIGFDNITESICQMAMGRQARNNGIKTQVGLSNMKTKSFTNFLNQENHNILLTTWVDLILYTCQPQTLYNITQSLNLNNSSQQFLKNRKKTWTPSIGSSSTSKRQTDTPTNRDKQPTIDFKSKMLSLLNFMILNTTKNILLESITKANFLSVVMVEILVNRNDNRSLKDFQLRPLKQCDISFPPSSNSVGNTYKRLFSQQDQAIIVYDLRYHRQLWVKQSLQLIYSKWRKVVQIIFQQQVKNPHIYWQLVFEKCASLINRQLSLLTVLVFNLVQVIENINAVVEKINNQLFEKIKMSKEVVQRKKKELVGYRRVREALQHIVRDVIGCPQIFSANQTSPFPFSSSHSNSPNSKHNKQFSRIQHGLKLVNRQQQCKQLLKWQQIMHQNILITESYISNLQLINNIFDHHPYHVAQWFINFDKQTRVLIRKVKKENLQLFFQKFYQRVPKQWASLNYEQHDEQQEIQVQNYNYHQQQQQILLSTTLNNNNLKTFNKHTSNLTTPLKHHRRISYIKGKRQLSAHEKQALILNYMIKAQLQLFQSYTKSHISNCRQRSTTMTTIITSVLGGSGRRANYPFLLEDANIQRLLMFNYKNAHLGGSGHHNKQRDIITNRLFVKRTDKATLTTVKPLSNFAPTTTLQPRALRQQNLLMYQPHNQQPHHPSQFEHEYQIDVSLLQIINYTPQQLQFLSELNTHLRFINEINFQYEYYYWKTLSYEKKNNKHDVLKANAKVDNLIQETVNSSNNGDNNNNGIDDNGGNNNNNINNNTGNINTNNKNNRSSQSSQTSSYHNYISPQQRKMLTLNQYTKQKTQNLLNTQQLYLEFEKINIIINVTRPIIVIANQCYQYQKLIIGKNNNHVESSQREEEKSLYNQKIGQFIARLKVHNQSLVEIVNAALSAKNYWKALSSNVFPEDDILVKNSKQLQDINHSTLNNTNTIINMQSNHQQRFFCNKILSKIQQYINYYREISQQMEYDLEQQKFVNTNGPNKGDNNNHVAIDYKSKYVQNNNNDRQMKQQGNNINNKSQQERKSMSITRQLNKKPSILEEIQMKSIQKARMFSLIQGLLTKNNTIKKNRFEIAGEIYQYSEKILLLNCYMASFYIDRRVYLQIISQNELTQQKYSKVKIIGKEYFQKIKNYNAEIAMQKELTEDNLKNVQLIYEKKVLILLVSLMELLYYGNEQVNTLVGKWRGRDQRGMDRSGVGSLGKKGFERGYKNHAYKISRNTLNKYSSLMRKFLKYRLSRNTNSLLAKQHQTRQAAHFTSSSSDPSTTSPTSHDYTYISKMLSQMLQFNESTQQVRQQQFISTLIKLRNQQNDESFLKFFIQIIQKQTAALSVYGVNNQQEKVSCLKKKFSYLILRQVYFFLHYDIDCLEEKSAYSKKNYEMYENRVLDFYEEIIAKNYHDFVIKKQQELKKRSVYLQNYLMKYQEQPELNIIQKSLNKLIVCVFNQILLIYTQEIKMEIKKKSGEQESFMARNNQNNGQLGLHTTYLSGEFYEDKGVANGGGKGELLKKVDERNSQNGGQIVKRQSESSDAEKRNSTSFLAGLLSKLASQNNSNLNNPNTQAPQQHSRHSIRSSIRSSNMASSVTSPLPYHIKTFKVFTLQSMNLHQAINIYHSIHNLNSQSLSKYLTQLKQSFINTNILKREDFTEMEITTLTVNQQSIVSLLKREIIEAINQLRFNLVEKNLISRIQKLYINLDVRHKVFESFQDKILSYEMQKAKIYHQYMDYIRGLKLDVYSHIANEDSLPYIKILHAIKLYRLEVKKEQLENKVRQQFGKNLKKWNQGIRQDLINYQQWLDSQERHWDSVRVEIIEQKQKYLVVYDSILKELRRQARKKEIEDIQKNRRSSQNIKKPLQLTLTDSENPTLTKSTKQIKKITASKKKLIEFNKTTPIHKIDETSQTQSIIQQKMQATIPINLSSSQPPQILFVAQKKEITIMNQMKKPIITNNNSNSFHNLAVNRSLTKYSKNEKKQLERPTTSMNIREYDLGVSTTMKSTKSKDFYNRASTAVTREKSLDLQASQFRGISMKFYSKSNQKYHNPADYNNYDEFPTSQQMKNFKRSSLKPEHIQRVFSGYLGGRKQEKSLRELESNQSKRKKLVKQGRTVNSALPERKVIMRNF